MPLLRPEAKLWRRALAHRQPPPPEHDKGFRFVSGPPPRSPAEARKLLKVGTDASQEVIRAAYKRAASRSHPLENPTKDAKLKYQRVRAAYLCLWESASQENSRTNWRPSETCMSSDEDFNGGQNQMPTFEDAEKAFNATFGRVNPKINTAIYLGAIENKLNRAKTMHILVGASTPSPCEVLEQPRSRQCSSPLGSHRFDPQRATV